MKDRYTLNQGRNALIDSEADQPVRIFFTNNVYVCKTSTGMFKERSPEELARLLNRTANQQSKRRLSTVWSRIQDPVT